VLRSRAALLTRTEDSRLVHAFEQGPLHGALTLAAALLIALLFVLLPKAARIRLRGPLVLFGLHLFTKVLVVALDPSYQRIDNVLALLFLLLCIARAGSVLVVDWFLGHQLNRQPPKIIRDISEALLYAGVVLVALRAAGFDASSLLTTSALLTAVIGLSLQDTLGNLFAGLALQAERPFEVGDFIQWNVENQKIGQVVEINWRATKVRTDDLIEIVVPNGQLARSAIAILTKPTRTLRRSVYVLVGYQVAPERVRRLLVQAAKESPGVLAHPEPSVVTWKFADGGIEYWLRYFIEDVGSRDRLDSGVRDRIYYALSRARIEFAVDSKVVHVHEHTTERVIERDAATLARSKAALRAIDFLQDLPIEAFDELAQGTATEVYGPGETVVQQGDAGDCLFIVMNGEVSVMHAHPGQAPREIARFGPGGLFGEMSVMTGAPRTAAVRATRETELLVMGKAALQPVLDAHPGFASSISERLALRQAELEAMSSDHAENSRTSREIQTGIILKKIKNFFGLG
jgi:small-conductance mechanosensitive channel/CRP-like cAMP-binding protein